MPIYEYQCKGCGEVFEVFQKVSDPPPRRHACGSHRIRRVMSQTSFILKGSGWYLTDYARKEKDKSGKKERETSDKTSTGKTEKKSQDATSPKAQPTVA